MHNRSLGCELTMRNNILFRLHRTGLAFSLFDMVCNIVSMSVKYYIM